MSAEEEVICYLIDSLFIVFIDFRLDSQIISTKFYFHTSITNWIILIKNDENYLIKNKKKLLEFKL